MISFGPYIPNAFPGDDMEARWMGVRHLTQTYTLEALGIIENGTTATLTVTDKTGVQRHIKPERRGFTSLSPALKAPPDVAAPLYLSRVEENFWTHRLDELGALYVRLKIVRNGEDESIAPLTGRQRLFDAATSSQSYSSSSAAILSQRATI
jgi:hypothetical protein